MAKTKSIPYKELSNNIRELAQEMLRGGGMGRLYWKVSPVVWNISYNDNPPA